MLNMSDVFYNYCTIVIVHIARLIRESLLALKVIKNIFIILLVKTPDYIHVY